MTIVAWWILLVSIGVIGVLLSWCRNKHWRKNYGFLGAGIFSLLWVFVWGIVSPFLYFNSPDAIVYKVKKQYGIECQLKYSQIARPYNTSGVIYLHNGDGVQKYVAVPINVTQKVEK